MHFKVTRSGRADVGDLIRFEGAISMDEVVRLNLSPADQVLINKAMGGPQFAEDTLRVIAMLFQKHRERNAK